jgi:hypothetical protein
MPDCPHCGFPIDPAAHATCPKCESPTRAAASLGVLEVDVAHDGESWETAKGKIDRAVDQALHWGHAGVKIIHGHGSATGRAVIAPRAIALLRHYADTTGGRFANDRNNPGASLIWFNR